MIGRSVVVVFGAAVALVAGCAAALVCVVIDVVGGNVESSLYHPASTQQQHNTCTRTGNVSSASVVVTHASNRVKFNVSRTSSRALLKPTCSFDGLSSRHACARTTSHPACQHGRTPTANVSEDALPFATACWNHVEPRPASLPVHVLLLVNAYTQLPLLDCCRASQANLGLIAL
jgi:hypothetical protein